jgi:hypothetical protein
MKSEVRDGIQIEWDTPISCRRRPALSPGSTFSFAVA